MNQHQINHLGHRLDCIQAELRSAMENATAKLYRDNAKLYKESINSLNFHKINASHLQKIVGDALKMSGPILLKNVEYGKTIIRIELDLYKLVRGFKKIHEPYIKEQEQISDNYSKYMGEVKKDIKKAMDEAYLGTNQAALDHLRSLEKKLEAFNGTTGTNKT